MEEGIYNDKHASLLQRYILLQKIFRAYAPGVNRKRKVWGIHVGCFLT